MNYTSFEAKSDITKNMMRIPIKLRNAFTEYPNL